MELFARWLSRGGTALLAASLAAPLHAQPDEPTSPPEPESEPVAEDPAGESDGAAGTGAEDGDAEPGPADRGDGGGEPTEPEGPESPSEGPEPGDGAADETAAAAAGARGGGAAQTTVGEPAKPPPEGAQSDGGEHEGRFAFGTYGRVIAASDGSGRPGRDVDIVAHGSRLDLNNYVELELRREDTWTSVEADTRMVATLALGHPIFHYDGDFDAALAVRNLYLEERGLGLPGLSVWAGSRMLRGDDIYLLDFWPLDNLNTVGGGVRYDVCGSAEGQGEEGATGDGEEAQPRGDGDADSSAEPAAPPPWCTAVQLHGGLGQPSNPFYQQLADRPAPLNQFGAASVAVLDRQRWVFSLKGEQIVRFGGPGGIKLAAYGEVHSVPSAQRETAQAGVFEPVPADTGFVIGGQLGGFLGDRGTFINLFVRYAQGLAAYGEFGSPEGLADDRSADGAREILVATSANWEMGPVAVTLGGYFRSFRNANDHVDFSDVDEGIVVLRPHLFFIDWAGVAVEGSYQALQRGVLVADLQADATTATNLEPLMADVGRIGVIPFLAPGGPGAFSRPWFFFTYVASFRNDGARLLYPEGDVFRIREIEHYAGFGAEWWFGSTSYGD